MSHKVADFMEDKGYAMEQEYVRTIACWHEASDGRGLSQLERSHANYQMLNYLLDEWMPWHHEVYDFLYADVNKPLEGIRGFTLQTALEVIANVETQEHRRRMNHTIGFVEHPRASSTDDVEAFFSITRRLIGLTFTAKEFSDQWSKLVKEYVKRIDPDLPFYYWTPRDPFTLEYHEFDDSDEQVDESDHTYVDNGFHTARLHRTCTSGSGAQRASKVFVSGANFLPAKHRPSIRQQLFKPEVPLPPVPDHLAHHLPI